MTTAARPAPSSEAGFSMVEMMVTMAILGVVLGAVTTMFVRGNNSEAALNLRFQAQQDARNSIDLVRRDGHRACDVKSASGASISFAYWDPTLATPACGATATITWCTRASGAKFALYRVLGASCGASGGTKYADNITTASGNVFAFSAAVGTVSGVANQHTLALLKLDLTVNMRSDPLQAYHLQDDVALRNTVRT